MKETIEQNGCTIVYLFERFRSNNCWPYQQCLRPVQITFSCVDLVCESSISNFVKIYSCQKSWLSAEIFFLVKLGELFFSRREYNLTLPAISVACPKLAQSQYNVLLNFICVWVRVEVKGEFISLTDTADDSHTIHRV